MTKKVGLSTSNIGRGTPRRRPPNSIEALFGGRAVGQLLKLFFLNPSRDFYQRELSALTGERLFLVQLALKRLMTGGLLDATRRGNRTYFQANRAHPAFPELKSLILKTFGFGDRLREGLRPLASRISLAFVYGSTARGDDVPGSDIDLMIVGDVTRRDVAAALASVKRELGREINTSIYRYDEFRSRAQTDHPFFRDVLRGPKIFLIGNDEEIRTVRTRR